MTTTQQGPNPVRSRRRLVALISAVAIVVVAAVATFLLVRPTDDVDSEKGRLEKRVSAMYGAVFSGDYGTAYQFRSKNCRTNFSQDQYVASMRDLLGDRPYPQAKVNAEVSLQSGSTARVTIDAPGPQFPGGTRTWTRADDNNWYFDNCQALKPVATP